MNAWFYRKDVCLFASTCVTGESIGLITSHFGGRVELGVRLVQRLPQYSFVGSNVPYRSRTSVSLGKHLSSQYPLSNYLN
jgi:hypothetical protein